MKMIGVLPNFEKKDSVNATTILVKELLKYSFDVGMPRDKAEVLGLQAVGKDEKSLFVNSDLLIAVGGDGTIKQAALTAFKWEKPIFGINAGRVGFLASAEINEIQKAVKSLVKKEYIIQERRVLEAWVERGSHRNESSFALNDVEIVRRSDICMVTMLTVFIDGKLVASYPGDGIIIATPAGSTAYSLSAGGPIVEPDMDVIIITPICSRNGDKPIVARGDREIVVTVTKECSNLPIVLVDGTKIKDTLGKKQKVVIRRAESTVNFITFPWKDYFDEIEKKLKR